MNQVARCWVLMRNVTEEAVQVAREASLSKDAVQKLKATSIDASRPA